MAQLKVSHISKAFDDQEILKDVTLELRDNELVSLLGVSGGGKTTLFNVISGLLKPRRRTRCFWMEKTLPDSPEM